MELIYVSRGNSFIPCYDCTPCYLTALVASNVQNYSAIEVWGNMFLQEYQYCRASARKVTI